MSCRSSGVLAVLFFTSLTLTACGGGDDEAPAVDAGPANPLQPPPAADGVQFAMDVTAPAQSEVWKCQVGRVPGVETGQLLDFKLVESKQSANIHHMDLSVLTQPEDDIPDGVYDCAALYAERPKLMDEIIIYASQHPEQQLRLPQGTAAEVPSGVKTMLEVHYVNTTETEQTVFTRINAYWYKDPHEVQQLIWGRAVRDKNLVIPPGATTDEWTRCVLDQDIDLLVLSTHTHQLATETEVFRWDGAQTGERIYSNTDWHAPVLMDLTQAPIHVPAGQGFEFHCHYQNPTDKLVNWGFKASDEMCQMALVYTPGNPSIECKTIATSDGVLGD